MHSHYEQIESRPAYQNPFAPSRPGARPLNSVLQAPLIVDDLISDTSSDIFGDSGNYNGPFGGKRSQGEIGPMPSEGHSPGEIKKFTRKPDPARNKDLG